MHHSHVIPIEHKYTIIEGAPNPQSPTPLHIIVHEEAELNKIPNNE